MKFLGLSLLLTAHVSSKLLAAWKIILKAGFCPFL
jgi:hypothetical protein